MSPKKFVSALADVRMPNVFNPYSDVCPHFDLTDAPARRRSNLEAHLQASLDLCVNTLWVARDLGYRGGRRTGIALTDEANLGNLTRSFGKQLPVVRATRGPVVAERTAAVIWGVVQEIQIPVFTWNVFPLHPHGHNDPLSNRCHSRSERQSCKWILEALLELLQPTKIVAIGNDAASGLEDLGVECLKVRHPSYGGVADFKRGIWSIYGYDSSVRRENHSPRFF
ncbi:uracil-DNA glycosylase [Sphingomonas mesophila]|uniref:uracil-DNA glycosylase n=1 Tax=Sphingomonas mesophila TaxID=2303576 RepID=UPI000E598060|nr:uracil-DNA glycosylase [Sphingomonas mesophila]